MLNGMSMIRSIRNLRWTVGLTLGLLCVVAIAMSSCRDEVGEMVQQDAPLTSEPQEQASEDEAQSADASQEQAQQAETEAASESDETQAQAQQDDTSADQRQQDEETQSAPGTGSLTFLPRDATETPEGIPIIRDAARPQYFGLDWSTHWGIRLVDLEDLAQGAARDAIPAISGPLYWSLEEASEIYTDNIPLVQVNVNGDVRGFPLEILTWHEIVNDTIGGVPVVVTYCPLCNTAIAFESQVGERLFKFGVSGLLRNSDLVMYDRNTESLWQQSSGRAIVGTMVGARLNYVAASVVTVGQLRSAYPDALVMSRETGWDRPYGQNPYRGYDNPETGGPYTFFFDRETIDERLPPAERVVSIEGPSGAAKAYAWSALAVERAVHDTFDGIDLVVFWTPGALSILDTGIVSEAREVGTTAVFETTLDGQPLTFAVNPADDAGQTFVDDQTGSVWDIFGRAVEGELAGSELTRVIHSDHFWFAWQAFHPSTSLLSLDNLGEDS